MTQQKNCNIVLLKYNSEVNACEEIRQNIEPLTFDEAQAEVQKNKQPLYFYIIGSEKSTMPYEVYNKKGKAEVSKIKPD
jgi:hypothetical protein